MQINNPVNLKFGSGIREKILEGCIDKKTLIFCSSTALRRLYKDPYLKNLFDYEGTFFEHDFNSNPSLEEIERISEKYRKSSFDLIIGLGGGSAMDVAKIGSASISAIQENITISELLEDSNLFSHFSCIDSIQVPTTAGTGSEVTPFATIWDYKNNEKKSLGSDSMFAKQAFVDPDLLKGMPKELALFTGLDAMNQAFESIWNLNANEETRRFSIKSALLCLENLPLIDNMSSNIEVREKMSEASLFAGYAISQTRTSICHSISYPLTLKYGMPHGLACAFSMLEVYKYNEKYLKNDITEIKQTLNENPFDVLQDIFLQYDLKRHFREYLPDRKNFINSLEDFITSGRFENNIQKCSQEDLVKILTFSYESCF